MDGFPNEVTRLLVDIRKGDRDAVDRLLPILYSELRKIAASQLRRERSNHTLQPTALVHEAYVQLVGQQNLRWENRAHFLGIAAHLMRQILIVHARRRRAAKRDGGLLRVTLDDEIRAADQPEVDVLALDEALERLAVADPLRARVVELRYFGGLSIDETAEVLGVGTATVERSWRTARAWLWREMTGSAE
jgi:RNA polymerase sigma factor (TIGR02999 family)